MSAPYVETHARVTALTGCESVLHVNALEDPADGPTFEVNSDATPAEAARPRGGITPCLGFEILINGARLDLSLVSGTISVSRSYDERLQQWEFSVVLTSPTAPLGSPFLGASPPTGKRTIDVLGLYLTSTGIHRVPLITGGIADTSDREGGEGGYTESITGVCRGGRFDRKLATYVLPPGHGLPRGRVLKLLADAAGETQTNLEDGNPTVKEVQVVDGDWLAIGAEQQEVENRRVFWDRDGYLVNPKIGRPRADEPIHWDFEERDFLLRSKFTVRHKADVLTDVTVTGTEQIAADSEDLGDVMKVSEKISRAVFAPAQPGYIQSSGGSYTAQGSADTPVLRIVGKMRFEQTLRAGVTVYDRKQVWAFVNPQAARYAYSTGSQEWEPLDTFTTDNVAGSTGAAHQFPQEQLTTVSLVENWHYYDKAGYRRPVESGAAPEVAWLEGQYPRLTDSDGVEIQPTVGFYLGSITRTAAIGAVRKAVLERTITGPPPFDSWESLEPANGTLRMGTDAIETNPALPWLPGINGSGDQAEGEWLMPMTETILNVVADDLGYTVKERTVEKAWGSPEVGFGAYLYGDGTERLDASETFREVGAVDVDYIRTDEGAHKRFVSTYSYGVLVRTEEDPKLEGYPPAVDRIEVQERNASAYADGELAQFARYARRSETRQIKVNVTAPELERYHERGVLKTDVPWAENESELAQVGAALIDESAAADVSFTLPGNFFIEPVQVIHCRYMPLALDRDMRVRRVRWSQAPRGPVLTDVEAKLYGW